MRVNPLFHTKHRGLGTGGGGGGGGDAFVHTKAVINCKCKVG